MSHILIEYSALMLKEREQPWQVAWKIPESTPLVANETVDERQAEELLRFVAYLDRLAQKQDTKIPGAKINFSHDEQEFLAGMQGKLSLSVLDGADMPIVYGSWNNRYSKEKLSASDIDRLCSFALKLGTKIPEEQLADSRDGQFVDLKHELLLLCYPETALL